MIDPLSDGMTGQQSVTTRSMGERLATLVRQQYPHFDVQPFSGSHIARSPMVLIGTFTGVNAQRQTSRAREAHGTCFALADLKTGKLGQHGARVLIARRCRYQGFADNTRSEPSSGLG